MSSSLRLFATRTFQAARQNQVKFAQAIRNAVVTKVTRTPLHTHIHIDIFLAPKTSTSSAPPAALPRAPMGQSSSAPEPLKTLQKFPESAEPSRAKKAVGAMETAAEVLDSSAEAWTDDSYSSDWPADD